MSSTKNSNLHKAKSAKQDEFYTQWSDIEKEMFSYYDFDPDVFRGKTILLPCDDPEWSNFTKFFALNFEFFGLKKLISISYSNHTQGSPQGRILVLDEDLDGDGVVNINDIHWEDLQGDGDFRSDEVTKLRDQADMVITNPPFSLFRDFVAWLIEGDVKFSVIGSMNAITYKEIFPLIKNDELWLGATGNTSAMAFRMPPTIEAKTGDNEKAAKMGCRTGEDINYAVLGNTCWFTNIEHGVRNESMNLMTMEDNLRFNKKISGNPNSYIKYDNYDAIEVPATSGIPSDFDGVMGVPISFLNKYNPDQFDIISFRKGDDGKDLVLTRARESSTVL